MPQKIHRYLVSACAALAVPDDLQAKSAKAPSQASVQHAFSPSFASRYLSVADQKHVVGKIWIAEVAVHNQLTGIEVGKPIGIAAPFGRLAIKLARMGM